MSKKKESRTLRVPNPRAPVRGRLKTPPHKVHGSKRAYARRVKHPRPLSSDD